MTVRYSVLIGMAAALASGGNAHAYEVQTHANLTRHAYDLSTLADPASSPLLAFDVEDQGEPRFTTRAIDDLFPFADLESINATAREVVALGAHQEDIPITEGRFLNHFFDPQRGGIGLNVPGLGPGLPSPDWVLEDQGQVNAQQDSFRDALEFHRLALTLPQQAERDLNLGRLLEILGRSVHHLQDMAQPAHVRNDGHPPWDFDIYEKATEKLFGEGLAAAIPRTSPYQSGAVDLGTFDTARKFWTNSGRGIAEFSSRNFVSRDTNFRRAANGFGVDPDHQSPVVSNTESVTLAALGILNSPLPPSATINFLHTQVHDAYSNQSLINDRASTWSLFLPDLQSLSIDDQNIVTLNRLNFANNYQILLPRAIAYSAGLINYYFRGRLELEDFGSAGGVNTITIRNVSAPDFAMGSGLPGFRLFYDAVGGQRREIENVEELDDPGAELEFDQTRRLSFTAPADVDLRKENQYLLMFDGMIGTETGVAALRFGRPGAGLWVSPSYLPTDGVSGPRQLTWDSTAWTVAQAPAAGAGQMDWKGHKPEDVLSWGSGRRYHSSSGGGPVYMNGRVLTLGPALGYHIIGASIRYIGGQRVLNLATHGAGSLRIYSRVFAERYENEDLWSAENPLGWRLVYSGAHGMPYTGFFFNASGNEGQYITRDLDQGRPELRVKVNLSGFSGTSAEFPAVATVTRTERQVASTEETLDIEAGICFVSPGYPFGAFMSGGEGCGIAYSGTEDRTHHYTVTEQYAERTLFCVDYRGDQEVFCELLPPPSPTVLSRLTETFIGQSSRHATNPWCPDPDKHDLQYTNTQTTEDNPTRIMRIGNLEIPWTAESRSQTITTHQNGAFREPVNHGGDETKHLTTTTRRTRLIQFDARHDFAVYEQRSYESVSDFTSNYSFPGSMTYNDAQSHVRSERVIMEFGGQREVLFDETESTSSDTPGTGNPQQFPQDGLQDCLPRPPLDLSTTTTFVDAAATGSIFSIMSAYGSYAIDRAGRLGLSLRITQFDSPYSIRGYRNFLTGGDVLTLIPGTPPAAEFSYDIRLIR